MNGEDYDHGITVPYGSACVDAPVAEYFPSGTQPSRRTDCAGKTLPTSPRPASIFADPMAASRLVRQLEEIVAGQ